MSGSYEAEAALRLVLERVSSGESGDAVWSSAEGRVVLAELDRRSRHVARVACESWPAAAGRSAQLAGVLTSEGWVFLADPPEALLGSVGRPWAYVEAFLRRVARREMTATVWQCGPGVAANPGRRATSSLLLLDDRVLERELERRSGSSLVEASPLGRDVELVREVLAEVVDALAGVGVPRGVAEFGVWQVVAVVSTLRSRDRIHRAARADERLAERFSPTAVTGLLNLLLGTRRQGAESSLVGVLVEAAREGRPMPFTALAHVNVLRDLEMVAADFVWPASEAASAAAS
ncbi:MAG: hypothetical protein QM621_08175 [Aeromicrobium sp.]|uniref:hypothetical protein n=1 Tax=Aeromicrobium sp. TaxID=1871063 RepID=UPI0039E28D7F